MSEPRDIVEREGRFIETERKQLVDTLRERDDKLSHDAAREIDDLAREVERLRASLATAEQENERLTGIIGTLEASYRGLQEQLSRYSTEKATAENALATLEAAEIRGVAPIHDASCDECHYGNVSVGAAVARMAERRRER